MHSDVSPQSRKLAEAFRAEHERREGGLGVSMSQSRVPMLFVKSLLLNAVYAAKGLQLDVVCQRHKVYVLVRFGQWGERNVTLFVRRYH